jgi:hypothetical protein
MTGEDEDETRRLREMEQTARDFISNFDWCNEVLQFYFGAGVGDVIAVFLAQIRPDQDSVDEYLWIVVGDLPSAYLVTDACANPKAALEGYIWEMRKWVALARQGQSSDDVIPVNVPAIPEWAEALGSRLDFVEKKIIPRLFGSSVGSSTSTGE